jgi:2-polyprenyl-3-methyl-5-hydroxy-6-metoxy-1,4-benzoquinol methylase
MAGSERAAEPAALRQETQRIWDANAAFWDSHVGEGHTFHKVLVEPAVDRLLALQAGESVLEIGCGNGAYARHMADGGAHVLATDFSSVFLERAQGRSQTYGDRIEYRQLDATDEARLLALGEGRFDAVVSNMALMDMPAVEPLFGAIGRLLRPGGRFIVSVMHPCFNTLGVSLTVEDWDRDGVVGYTYAAKVTRYLGLQPAKGFGILGQPEPHYYFHRPLHILLGAAFRAGLVMDGIEEAAFPPSPEPRRPGSTSWENYSEIPAVLAVRLRTPRDP